MRLPDNQDKDALMRPFSSERDMARKQGGVALLEVMIAILIFSFGVLGLVGLQANSIVFLSDARDRVDASQLATQLASAMQVTAASELVGLSYSGSGSVPDGLKSWMRDVERKMPGASLAAARPIVAVTAAPGPVGSGETVYSVAITVRWQPPNGDVRRHRLDFVIPN